MSNECMLFSNKDLFPIYLTSAKYLATAYQQQKSLEASAAI